MLDTGQVDRLSRSDRIAGLDVSAFSEADVLNVVLQRSEVMFDLPRPGQAIRAWSAGDPAPLQRLIAGREETLLRRALSVIYLEYRALSDTLDRLAPGRVADIGCGYAIFDLFLAQDRAVDLILIDLEDSPARHFGFQDTAAAYANLAVARRFLTDNGIAAARIATLNPATDALDTLRGIDLAVSFLSCGFHYPVSTYAGLFRDGVVAGGAVILDLRDGQIDDQCRDLAALGTVEVIAEGAKWRRVLMSKPKAGAGE